MTSTTQPATCCVGLLVGQRRKIGVLAGAIGLLTLTGAAVALAGPLVVRAPVTLAGPDMLRLRVVAASNAPADQAVKLRVRDALLPDLSTWIEGASDRASAVRSLQPRLAQIRATAERAAGPGTAVTVSLGPDRFPARRLGLIAFPAGSYETLRVTLGAGLGHNWWTVLFPPFAFVSFGRDVAVVGPADPPSGEAASGGPEDPTVTIVAARSPGAAPVEVRFALWDLWRKLTRSGW